MADHRLFLIDSFGFIFRAYYARTSSGASPMRTSQGIPTEAVYVFHNMIRRLLAEYSPTHIAAVFESKEPTFREKEFPAYKANRPEMPPDLAAQIPHVRRMLEAMSVPVLECSGYEADDVIGTVARAAAEQGTEVVVVSSDKDLLQLVGGSVSMLDPAKDDVWYDAEKALEFMGVEPDRIPDLLALKGDKVDNIPGAPGIGEKGAKDLLQQFGSLEALLERAPEVQRKSYRQSLETHREQILMSKRLATVETAAPVPWSLPQLQVRPPDRHDLEQLYRELEFFSLLKTVVEAAEDSAANADYQTLSRVEEVEDCLENLPPEARVAVALQPGSGNLLEGNVIGLSHKAGWGRAVPAEFAPSLTAWLEDAAKPKAAHDVKSLLVELARLGIEGRGFTDDALLMAFLLSADPGGCSLEALALRRLGRTAGASAEERAAAAWELCERLEPELEAAGLRTLYDTIEVPLAPVLAGMERTGIRIEPEVLRAISAEMETEIARLTAGIHTLAGHEFNINSPQQLAKVLFEELALPAPERTGKTKSYSTAADVLESLAAEHAIARLVLEYRQLAKLKGTYVDALPALINPRTGRLHTTLNPAGAATGRLSSSEPNLQNIPIRTAQGRGIRAAFVPEPGWKLLVADYSQIELRLLAHLSRDPVLLEAFRNGEDIHTRTAAEVFGTPPLMVTPEQRRRAKAVNFGIVYGQSAFGLSAQLGIPRQEAEEYIASYFERYAGVRRFIDKCIAEARSTRYARTMFDRRRPIPDIHSSNPSARGFAERTAVNTPLQGAAADLIKLAMVRIDAEFRRRSLNTRMLLQVHDELIFESPPEEIDETAALVRREMETVHRLEVPLLVELGIGDNWRDAK